jgi:hypothetical protein
LPAAAARSGRAKKKKRGFDRRIRTNPAGHRAVTSSGFSLLSVNRANPSDFARLFFSKGDQLFFLSIFSGRSSKRELIR